MARQSRSASRQGRGWWPAKRPVLRFVALFVLVMGVFYALTAVPAYKDRLFPSYLRWTASVSTGLLNGLGRSEASSSGSTVSSGTFALQIREGCDALEPCALFLAAVIAFPVGWRPKMLGAVLGVTALLSMNFVRIVSLYYVRDHAPDYFHTMHVDVWQPAFILLVLVFWLVWMWRATRA